MYKNRKLILGVAPTRRDYFTNETVEANRDRILSVTRELCAQYDVQMVGIEGLSPDGMMSDIHTADRIIQRFREQGVNALFIPHCNFGQEETVLRLGRAMQVPLLLWGERDEAPNGFAWRTTDTQCGLFASGKALYRGGVPFTYIENCMMDDAAFRDGFRDFLTAARIVANLRGTRIAQISVRPQPFLSVMINESELLERFGFEVIPVPATQILSSAKALADTPEAKAVLEGYTAAGVDTSRMDQQSLRNMAGLELAIEQFAAENGCSSVVSECWNIFGESLGIRPCAVFGNLIDKGLPVACENDVHGAISMLIAQTCNNGAEPVFLADLTQRHPTNDNAELLWHCGPFPKGLKKSGGHAFLSESMGQWELKDGSLTLVRFDGCRGTYQLLAGPAHTCQGPLTNGNYVWAEVDDWPRWERKLVCGPYIHHVAGVYGDYTRAVEEACKYLPVSFDRP